MNNRVIKIFSDNQINSSFVRANLDLIENNRKEFDLAQHKLECLQTLWKKNYRADFEFTRLIFDTEKDKTLFLLRWS